MPETEHAAFQASQAQARERHATRAEYAFMTPQEIEADIARRAEDGSPNSGPANIDRRDGDRRAADHATRLAIRDEVLTARATDPAGWAMRDDAVAASFTAAQENPDNPALASNASQQRIALQREMGIDQPRLLSDTERDEIAGALAQTTPADRPALIANLRARYGPHAGLLAAELTGEVDANTALLIAHAEVPQLPRLLAQGMEKAKQDGPATLTLANPDALNDLPPLPLVETGVPGGRKLDIPNLKSGRTYRAPGGAALFYNGEILVPSTVEMAPVASPMGTPGAPGPAPVEIDPLAPPMASRDLPALTPDVNPHAGEAAEAGDPPVDMEVEHTSLPTGKEEEEGTLGHETNGIDEASGEKEFAPSDISDPKDRREYEYLSIATENAKKKRAKQEQILASKQQQHNDGKIGDGAMAKARWYYKKTITEQDNKIEQNERRRAKIRTRSLLVPEINAPVEENKESGSGDLEEGVITLPTGPEGDEPVEQPTNQPPRARPRPPPPPLFHMSNPMEGLPRLRRDNNGDPEYHADRVMREKQEDGTYVNKKYEHQGLDIAALPKAFMRSPMSGTIRLGFAYKDENSIYKIVWVKHDNGNEVGLFYVSSYDEDGNDLVMDGDRVEEGEIIGLMQDRASASPGMENHYHLKVKHNGVTTDPTPWFRQWREGYQE